MAEIFLGNIKGEKGDQAEGYDDLVLRVENLENTFSIMANEISLFNLEVNALLDNEFQTSYNTLNDLLTQIKNIQLKDGIK